MQKAARQWLKLVNEIHDKYKFAPIGKAITKRDVLGQLHSEVGPAYVSHHRIEYWFNGRRHGPLITRFGTKAYFFKDVMVPPKYILEPQNITFEEVITHTNTEVRRVGCEIYGYDRMIQEKKFNLVHYDEKTEASLFNVKLNDADDMSIVKVLDGTPVNGVRKVYFLQVPPTMTKCHDAIAWTFNKKPEEYHPEIET